MSLSYIGQQITIYSGFFLLIIGVIGNGINIFIFSSIRTYRTTPGTFYFLVTSIFNIAYITINLITRIVITGYGIDLTRTSIIWCKIRQFCFGTLCLISLSCSCLATIDQFFSTSQSASIRRFSNIKWAPRIVFIIVIIWCLHGIPYFVFFNISPITTTCTNTNIIYAIYFPTHLVIFLCVVPVLIMIIFGYLTYRNIHLTRVLAQQQADRQLTRMIFIQIILVVISFAPYGINSAYGLITSGNSKDTNRLMIEGFVSTIMSIVSYFYYTGSCYMFLISSSRFRRAIKNRIFFCLRANQVIPFQPATNVRRTLNKRTNN